MIVRSHLAHRGKSLAQTGSSVVQCYPTLHPVSPLSRAKRRVRGGIFSRALNPPSLPKGVVLQGGGGPSPSRATELAGRVGVRCVVLRALSTSHDREAGRREGNSLLWLVTMYLSSDAEIWEEQRWCYRGG